MSQYIVMWTSCYYHVTIHLKRMNLKNHRKTKHLLFIMDKGRKKLKKNSRKFYMTQKTVLCSPRHIFHPSKISSNFLPSPLSPAFYTWTWEKNPVGRDDDCQGCHRMKSMLHWVLRDQYLRFGSCIVNHWLLLLDFRVHHELFRSSDVFAEMNWFDECELDPIVGYHNCLYETDAIMEGKIEVSIHGRFDAA